jgi:hypothetical protein
METDWHVLGRKIDFRRWEINHIGKTAKSTRTTTRKKLAARSWATA